jgi:hypothetical protein
VPLVRNYGHPNEVAARYQPPWTILDPADSTSFLRAAVIGAGVLLLLSAFTTGVMAWLGALVVAFAAKNWVRRLWPAAARWQPRDRDRTNRVGSEVVVLIATPCVVLHAAPAWVLEQVSGGRLDRGGATNRRNRPSPESRSSATGGQASAIL